MWPAPKPRRGAATVRGTSSRPPGASAASQGALGSVAPAFTKIASKGPPTSTLPSPETTVAFGVRARLRRASSASRGSSSTPTTLPPGTAAAAIAV